jgi:hypothetical protein
VATEEELQKTVGIADDSPARARKVRPPAHNVVDPRTLKRFFGLAYHTDFGNRVDPGGKQIRSTTREIASKSVPHSAARLLKTRCWELRKIKTFDIRRHAR